MSDTWIIRDTDRGNEREAESRSDAEETKNDLVSLGADPTHIEIVPPGETDGGTEAVDAEVVDHTDSDTSETAVKSTTADADPAVLAQDPIEWLESKNTAFVNTIKGTPAISKQGFRYIQQQFGITTESEVVETFDDPLGVIVWAKAERPSGESAEAHGEGYQFEGDVDDNEFVRYADTRAKNRAISDLTSAGALAVSELSGSEEDES